MAEQSPVQDWLTHGDRNKRGVPEGLWMACGGCGTTLYRKQVEDNLEVCPECEHHFYVPAATRIAQLLDQDSFEEWYEGLLPCDPLKFSDQKSYPERIAAEPLARCELLMSGCEVNAQFVASEPPGWRRHDTERPECARVLP